MLLTHDQVVIFAVAVSLISTTWVSTLMRIFVRTVIIKKSFAWDDVFILLSLASFTVTAVLACTAVVKDRAGISLDEEEILVDWINVAASLYIVTCTFLKLSIGIFFLRFLHERWQRRTIIATVAIYTVFAIAFVFVVALQCGGSDDILIKAIDHECRSWTVSGPLNYIWNTISAVTDWVFAISPIFVLGKMTMPKRAKVVACILLGLGAVSSICCMVKFAFIHELDLEENLVPGQGITLTALLEPGLGLIAASCATLRPLFQSCMTREKSNASSEINQEELRSPMRSRFGGRSASIAGLGSLAGFARKESIARVTAEPNARPDPERGFSIYGFVEELEDEAQDDTKDKEVVDVVEQVPSPSS